MQWHTCLNTGKSILQCFIISEFWQIKSKKISIVIKSYISLIVHYWLYTIPLPAQVVMKISLLWPVVSPPSHFFLAKRPNLFSLSFFPELGSWGVVEEEAGGRVWARPPEGPTGSPSAPTALSRAWVQRCSSSCNTHSENKHTRSNTHAGMHAETRASGVRRKPYLILALEQIVTAICQTGKETTRS